MWSVRSQYDRRSSDNYLNALISRWSLADAKDADAGNLLVVRRQLEIPRVCRIDHPASNWS
jgi:hypothetical protein